MEPLLVIFENYGLQLWCFLLLLIIAMGVWLMLLYRQIRQLRHRYAGLVTGTDGKDLGELLSMYVDQMGLAASRADQLTKTSEDLGRRLTSSIRRLGLVRFNAFEGTGGDQSFALALLDDGGNGVVLSSLQGRTEIRLYAKPLREWDSTHSLSVEEKEAIGQARQSKVDREPQL